MVARCSCLVFGLLLSVACGSGLDSGTSGPDPITAPSAPSAPASSSTPGPAVEKDASSPSTSPCVDPCAAGTVCARGECLAPAPTITTDTTLCGLHAYAGTFTVQGGAHVTCPSGVIAIEADDIVIDAGATIEVVAVSTRAGGIDALGCGDGKYGGASGGGYGNPGQSGGTGYAGGQTSCTVCPGRPSGASSGSSTDIVVEQGTRGGNGCAGGSTLQNTCPPANVLPGGKGGGSITLVAGASVKVLGLVDASGGNATPDPSPFNTRGGGGGGSGGGVLLAAPLVTLGSDSEVSARGGAGGAGWQVNSCASGLLDSKGGAGGNGRIKIASSSDTVTGGTVTGSVAIDRLPPMKIVSSTHPSSERVYGDAFSEVRIAWQKPYLAAKGVYYVLDQKPEAHVTQATGTFSTAIDLTLKAALFTTPGDWYVHFATIHADDSLSTLSSAWRVRISASVPVLTSTSHPDPESSYPSKTPAFAWHAPDDVPNGSWGSYYYRLDRSPSSVMAAPNAPGWTATTAMQVILTVDADGAALGDGVYHLHVVPVDTQGRLTRSAASRTIRIGGP